MFLVVPIWKDPSKEVRSGSPELKPIKGHQTSAPDYLDV